MGFLLRNGNEMLFYPTMPLEQKIGINGKTQNVPFESIYLLDEEDREILGIPELYPMSIRLEAIEKSL